jgi:hypothetical protein
MLGRKKVVNSLGPLPVPYLGALGPQNKEAEGLIFHLGQKIFLA